MARSIRAKPTTVLGTGQQIPPDPAVTLAGRAYSARKRSDASRATNSRQAVLEALSEREFQSLVIDGLRMRGYIVWHVQDSRLMAAGLPDILAYHPNRPGALIAYELKTATGRVRSEQEAAITHLQTVGGVDARVVRPADWDQLRESL